MNMCVTRKLIQPVITVGALLALANAASATVVSFSADKSDPFGAEIDFLNRMESFITEDFENTSPDADTVGEKPNPYITSVGNFKKTGADGGENEACLDGANDKCDRLYVLNQDASPFTGRYNTTDSNNDGDHDNDNDGQWLDSNDVTAFQWDIDESVVSNPNAFGFFLMDPSDQGATLEVEFADGTESASTNISGESDGELFYVSAVADTAFASATVTFENTAGDTDGDGYGVDDVTVARVPEPATLGLLGAGLMGIGIAFRSRRPV